ncbi:ABC transporter permease [Paenibacillus sacheonensis]|uniref:ABC transporter permease subunit n=1 Tax=Paenibacillus sacheonensis TaxID=742054 RepID=A0A7X4YKD9_9BACL|nr:ABC transporter permease subunit [Paenibacillus sacheonensis]MBM7563439.1 putative aldouronate transport system permease protein [Paenibacillus sacheonensis]NBC68006.1 ABC transporter permease subunit [Paenibacillus sacheonensis]
MAKLVIEQQTATPHPAPANRRTLWRTLYLQRYLLLMTVPFVIWALIFSYGPLWGWIMAFQKYKIGQGIWHSPFVGLDNFKELFKDDDFYPVLRNTLVMAVMNLVTGFVGAIVLALMLNEVKNQFFKRTIQTITYIPHFVSWVVIANIVLTFLSPDGGMVNSLLMKLGIIHEPIYFMAKEGYFWYIQTAANLWKEIGWSTIIYLAVLASLNPEHYEAADIDGATRLQKMRYISLPGIMPTAFLLLIMSLGWLIQGGFESQYLLGNDVVSGRSEVLDLYALRYSTQIGDFSYGVAISIFKSVVSIALVVSVNMLARKTAQTRLF